MSREKILSAVKQNKPAATPLPEIPAFPYPHEDLLAAFTASINKVGGTVTVLDNLKGLTPAIKGVFPEAQRIADFVQNDKNANAWLLEDVEKLDVVILKGQLGVAENGAIWLTDKDCVERVLPFITQHLVLLVDRATLVSTMHAAYDKIGTEQPAYGVFIAGPSKTADIEQSLVIGAHGPKSLQIFLI